MVRLTRRVRVILAPFFLLSFFVASILLACGGSSPVPPTPTSAHSGTLTLSPEATGASGTAAGATAIVPPSATPVPSTPLPPAAAVQTPTSQPPQAAPPTPTTAASLPPLANADGQRILSYVRKLADEIGPRPAGSPKEIEARDFISERLRSFGYEVELQSFTIPRVTATSATISFNVVARPPGKECETVTGGHFDSVSQAPGASDNATGTATVIEIAAILSQSGQMGANCFVLFGAEELGLFGSRFYVSRMTAADRLRLKAMLNFDMVGVGDAFWGVIGTSSLQTQAIAIAGTLGISVNRYQLAGASSDHAAFLEAGLPALMLHRLEDRLLHTPQDVSERVRPELLEQAAKIGAALLQALAAGG